MASVIQVLIMLVGFISVFALPSIDLEFASKYFSNVALVNLAIIFGAPLGALIQKNIIKGIAYDKILATMMLNIFFASLFLSITSSNDLVFTVLASITIGLNYYIKGVLIAENLINTSYLFNLLRGLILPVGALISANFEEGFVFFNFLIGTVLLIIIKWQWINLREACWPTLGEYLKISRSALYLSCSGGLIWLFFQMPRLEILNDDSSEIVILVQSMALPLALLSAFEARGPYVFNRILRSEGHPLLFQLCFICAFYGVAFFCFLGAVSFIETVDSTLYIDPSLATAFFGFSLVLSLHFEFLRRLLVRMDEAATFKIFFPLISFYAISAFFYFMASIDVYYGLLLVIFVVGYVLTLVYTRSSGVLKNF